MRITPHLLSLHDGESVLHSSALGQLEGGVGDGHLSVGLGTAALHVTAYSLSYAGGLAVDDEGGAATILDVGSTSLNDVLRVTPSTQHARSRWGWAWKPGISQSRQRSCR